MGKKKYNWTRWAIPFGIVGALVAWALLLSPALTVEEEPPSSSTRKAKVVFQEGRHFGPVQLDSLVGLIKRIDPAGNACHWQLAEDSLYVIQTKGYPQARFRRIFLGQRSAGDLLEVAENPVRMIRGDREGYAAPISQIGGQEFVEIPYALLTGMLEEWEGKMETRKMK